MLKTFMKGGVHPPEYKLSAQSKIKALPVPQSVVLPLSMHLGAPAKPIVKKGDKVKVGQLIAEGDGFVSANIHSPVSGQVLKVDKAPNVSGYKKPAIHIKTEGDEWEEIIDRSEEIKKECPLEPNEIIKKINDAGIVGLGGATFPSHVKLMVPKGKTIEALVVNGVECEPYLTADHALMLENGQEIMVGISILMKALNVKKALIGIENNKKDAIKHLTGLSKEYEGISVIPLKVKYPQGSEKHLIKAVMNREVPSGKLPLEVGAVVLNVGTIFSAYEAVQKNKPLIDRIITVTGKPLQNPQNFKARLGTMFSELIEVAGGIPENLGKVLNGGPMMGKAVSDLNVPMTKGSSGILLIDKSESTRKPVKACIRCSKCVEACPMGLEPYLLMTLSVKSMMEIMEKESAMDCVECGSCSYICPSNRPLLDYIRLGKNEIGKIIRARKK